MRRVRRTFWALVATAVIATGVLSRALAAEPGAASGVTVAVSASVLGVAALLAVRILVVLDRQGPPGRRRAVRPAGDDE
jgi:hypothetical protein